MQKQSITLLQDSWKQISQNRDLVIEQFYNHLFQSSPEMRPMFNQDLNIPIRQFSGMLNITINGIEQIDLIKDSLSSLGAAHRKIGVTPEQIATMEEALIRTFQEELGTQFNDELESVWREAFNVLARNMGLL